MKPISLHGHEKSITQIKYNREGDLLFSCAKDRQPNVWYSINGERLGTYDGHQGAVWCLDVDWQTKNFLSGAADNSVRYDKLMLMLLTFSFSLPTQLFFKVATTLLDLLFIELTLHLSHLKVMC